MSPVRRPRPARRQAIEDASRPEADAVARDEAALLQAAREALWRSLAEAASDLGVLDTTAPAALPPAPTRLVVQNWQGRPGLVPLGDVRIQLDPGQEVTLWLDRPREVEIDHGGDGPDQLLILADDDLLVG